MEESTFSEEPKSPEFLKLLGLSLGLGTLIGAAAAFVRNLL